MTDPTVTLDEVERLVGVLFPPQRSAVLAAIEENAAGVLRVAHDVNLDSHKLDAPAAVFLSRIGRSEHLLESADSRGRVTPAEAFRTLFTHRVEEARDTTDWPDDRCVEEALDYAVSYLDRCRISAYPAGVSPLTLEDDMRVTLNRPRAVTIDPQERSAMLTQWRLIAACLHDKRIAAMHRALMDNCAIPREPTHEEGRNARLALVAEINGLGVKPGKLAGAPVVEGWTSIGAATASA